ncbi:MAG: hypothetical protein LBB24_02850, partial [Rickettsiales bacterium]|nr:hypothetical protein [Rickettsiales bacterium]
MRNNSLSLLLLSTLVAMSGHCAENPKQSGVIREVVLRGNRHYNGNYYMEVGGIKIGDKFTGEIRNSLEKKIIATGYTDRVSARYVQKSGVLEIEIEEKPLISKITFNGAKELEKGENMENIRLKKGEIFSEKLLKEDINFINILYRSQGYFNVKINYEVKRLDDNLVEITFNISRGEEAKIRKIYFIGNQAFKDSILRDEIFSKENR